jgi:hypothetical protein
MKFYAHTSYGVIEVTLRHSSPRLEASDQPHVPDALPPGKELPVSIG